MAVSIDHYIVIVQPFDKAGSCGGGNCTSKTNSITISDTRVNTVYTFTVSAVNCAGVGDYSKEEQYKIEVSGEQIHDDSYCLNTIVSLNILPCQHRIPPPVFQFVSLRRHHHMDSLSRIYLTS